MWDVCELNPFVLQLRDARTRRLLDADETLEDLRFPKLLRGTRWGGVSLLCFGDQGIEVWGLMCL